ncbi:MAG TPA: hypothetical protein VFN24_00275 [Microbacterium sp.]|nr:hypothetical protein [Microbacterium sp.]
MPQLAASRRGLFPWRPWDFVLAAVGALAATALIVVALVIAVPPVSANLSSEVSDGATSVPIGDGQSSVVVPEGWIVQRDGGAVIARTPDGGLTARLAAAEGDARAVLQELLESGDDSGASAQIRAETLASGQHALHADGPDGAVYAVIGDTALVTVVATAGADHRPALGMLFEGVRP